MSKGKLIYYSSITKKVIMSLAGLFLLVFLLVHLGINLLLLKNDGGTMFSQAARFMSGNLFIKIFEVVLFGGFIIHIIIGLILQIQNWLARPVRYKKINSSHTSFFSKYMIYTGGIILFFLVIHFMNFYLVKHGIVQPPADFIVKDDFYTMAITLFTNKMYSIFYIIVFVFLGLHLNHAFQSVFQTLGFNHNKYTPSLKILGSIYAFIVSIGFMIIPLYFLFFYNAR